MAISKKHKKDTLLRYKIGVIIGLAMFTISILTDDGPILSNSGAMGGFAVIITSIAFMINSHTKRE